MRGHNSQTSTPTGLFPCRPRLLSANSPYISPIPFAYTPCINQNSLLDPNSVHPDFAPFKLQEDGNDNPNTQQIYPNQEQYSQIPPIPQTNDEQIKLDQNNMLEFIINNVNRNEKKLERIRQSLQDYGSEFNIKLFDFLVSKLKKLKKTKQEMVKYCIRKSFKHITTKMRSANKAAYINMENNEVLAVYFQKHCQGDQSISIPFKKNSEEKTMNLNFLKKIFKCRQYHNDYREFLRNFPSEYNSDNNKKIKSMKDAIKKAVKLKCFKGLDEFKRVPWSYQILTRIHRFAKELLEHSPYRHHGQKKQQIKIHQQIDEYEDSLLCQGFEFKPTRKKSMIFMTPPFNPKMQYPHIENLLD